MFLTKFATKNINFFNLKPSDDLKLEYNLKN